MFAKFRGIKITWGNKNNMFTCLIREFFQFYYIKQVDYIFPLLFLFLPHMTSYCVSITEQTTVKCNLFVKYLSFIDIRPSVQGIRRNITRSGNTSLRAKFLEEYQAEGNISPNHLSREYIKIYYIEN